MRKARAGDLAVIALLEKRIFQYETPWPLEEIQESFNSPHNHWFVHYSDESLAAYGAISDDGEIITVSVAPEYQGQGLGRKLMNRLLATVGGPVYLQVAKKNIKAIELYRSYGFIQSGELPNFYGRGRHAISMVRSKGRGKVSRTA